MEIGKKIKLLRTKLSLTQEGLAEKLNVTAQSVSKWETGVAMPDITLLPPLAETFGVSIDELFDLTVEQKLNRIENRMELEEELPHDEFCEYEEFLKGQSKDQNLLRATSLLAHLYFHQTEAFARKTAKYAKKAISLAPEKKDCQWLLCNVQNGAVWDWNVQNNSDLIDFYKEVIKNDTVLPRTPMPYYDLLDNLIADNRADEAEKYLEDYARLPAAKPILVKVYRAHIALCRHDVKTANEIMEKLGAEYPTDAIALFEVAQYYAKQCRYDEAVKYYDLSFEHEAKRPRFIDAPQAISQIYKIKGDYVSAANAQQRVVDCLREEWKMTEEVELKQAEKVLLELKEKIK